MGLLSKILGGLGLAYDIGENARETTTDVKNNKPEERKYDFDDGTGYTSEDFLRERKKRAQEKKKNRNNDGQNQKKTYEKER